MNHRNHRSAAGSVIAMSAAGWGSRSASRRDIDVFSTSEMSAMSANFRTSQKFVNFPELSFPKVRIPSAEGGIRSPRFGDSWARFHAMPPLCGAGAARSKLRGSIKGKGANPRCPIIEHVLTPNGPMPFDPVLDGLKSVALKMKSGASGGLDPFIIRGRERRKHKRIIKGKGQWPAA